MRYFLVILFGIMIACKSKTKVSEEPKETVATFSPQFTSGPRAFVYKTKGDYESLVPILLNDEGTEIISYPHPKDIIIDGGFPLPIVLKNGYLLDIRGINKNVAFLKMNYEVYSKLPNPPTIAELNDLILDKDPLLELCDCGNKIAFTDIEKQLNELIEQNKLKTTCKKIRVTN